jgi:hypothetical protein
MPRAAIHEKPLLAERRTLFDPVDSEDIEGLFKKTIREGEEALILAVLEDAIACFQKYVLTQNQREMKVFEEAEQWILEKNSDWLFSFESICEILQLHPDYLRQGLMRWKKEVRRKDRYVRTAATRRIDSKRNRYRTNALASSF